jgi:hypothetical protein
MNNTIYFFINSKPYTYPVKLKRKNTTKEEILKEFPTALGFIEVQNE